MRQPQRLAQLRRERLLARTLGGARLVGGGGSGSGGGGRLRRRGVAAAAADGAASAAAAAVWLAKLCVGEQLGVGLDLLLPRRLLRLWLAVAAEEDGDGPLAECEWSDEGY